MSRATAHRLIATTRRAVQPSRGTPKRFLSDSLVMAIRPLVAVLLVAMPITACGRGGRLLTKERTPLRTQGRFIVDNIGERVKWACVNWYGGESRSFIPGGLERRSMTEIAQLIVELGFNCVRLPYSLEAHLHNPVIGDEFLDSNRFHNGQALLGHHFVDVFDAVIDSLTKAGLMVIIDNHVSSAGWCCHWSQAEGFWYTDEFRESDWIDSLVAMASRYKSNPMVVGIDLRNEVHDYNGLEMTWGDGNPKTDWAMAATKAGNAVLEANPNLLIVVMSLCFGMELRPVREHPIQLTLPNRVVYQVHNYIEYQFWNLLPHDVGLGFESLRQYCLIALMMLLLLLAKLAHGWYTSGCPSPPLSVGLISFGFWLAGYGLVLVIPAQLAFNAGCRYCKWGVTIDILPYTYWALLLAACGVAISSLGWIHGWMSSAAAGSGDHEMLLRSFTADGEETPVDAESPASRFTQASSDLESYDHGLRAMNDRAVRSVLVSPTSHEAPSRKTVLQGAMKIATARGTRGWNPSWCCQMQVAINSLLLLPLFAAVYRAAGILGTSSFNASWLDHMWGFVLEEGQPYTAPVWMGEFGYLNHGQYWFDFAKYLSDRDVDFGYWAINGAKYGEGWIDVKTGTWNPWSGCSKVDARTRYLGGTDCTLELASWRGADTCAARIGPPEANRTPVPVAIHTKQNCHDFCKSKGRTCVKAGKSTDGACGLDSDVDAGCDTPLDDPICVCSEQYWSWVNESFGLLLSDYKTIAVSWRIRDLQALAESPSVWIPREIGCPSDKAGYTCDESMTQVLAGSLAPR